MSTVGLPAARRRCGNSSGRVIAAGDWIWFLSAAVLAFVAAAALSAIVFGRIPHVQDSIAQLFQARIFAAGRLWAPSPPLPELCDYANMVIADGRWYSQYPPGHALLLTLGVLAGVPWLINPLLGALSVLLIGLLAHELCGRSVGRLTALLALLSPFLLLMSAEFMNHASCLLGISGFLLFYSRMRRTARVRDAMLAGVGAALAILSRPYSAFGALLPCAMHAVWGLRHDRTRLFRPTLTLGLVAAAGGLLLLLYNWGTTGYPLRFGYSVAWGPDYGLGFGKGLPGEPHTITRGFIFTWDALQRLNARLFEWPLTSLWPLALGLFVAVPGCARGRRWLLAAVPVGLLAVYFFYWYHDRNDCFGPRFLYGALGPLLVLSAAGIHGASSRLAGLMRKVCGREGPRARMTLAIGIGLILLLSAWGGVTRGPQLFRAPQPIGEATLLQQSRAPFERFARDYWGVSPDLGRAVAEHIPGRALIFIDTQVAAHPNPQMRRAARHLQFGAAFAHQQPLLRQARVVYLHATPPDWCPQTADPSGEILRIMHRAAAHFPGRSAYLYRTSFDVPQPVQLDPSRRAEPGRATR